MRSHANASRFDHLDKLQSKRKSSQSTSSIVGFCAKAEAAFELKPNAEIRNGAHRKRRKKSPVSDFLINFNCSFRCAVAYFVHLPTQTHTNTRLDHSPTTYCDRVGTPFNSTLSRASFITKCFLLLCSCWRTDVASKSKAKQREMERFGGGRRKTFDSF